VDGRIARWSGQRERRRAEFVDAALEAIARHGQDTSTEQIAEHLGVSRTKLYRHFRDANELHRSVARRAADMIISDFEPMWHPNGTPMEIITFGVRTHIRWLVEHRNLYRYLARHSLADGLPAVDAIADVKATIGAHLTQLVGAYLAAFGLDQEPAEPLGYGIVGLVESATGRWLDSRAPGSADECAERLAGWVWLLLDHTLREGGVRLDPNRPLDLRRAVRPT